MGSILDNQLDRCLDDVMPGFHDRHPFLREFPVVLRRLLHP